MDFITKLMTTLDVFGWIGILGSLIVCLCYFLSIHNPTKYPPASNLMLGCNLFAAGCLGMSLFEHPNPGSILIELFWASVAVYGLIKNYKLRV